MEGPRAAAGTPHFSLPPLPPLPFILHTAPVRSLHHTNALPRQACCRRALGRTSWELGELLTERNSEAPWR